jgi:replicative superfamily II helicase
MAIRAVFIGIDKHSNPSIPELSGARRDALALHALFKDTLPDTEDQLLVDGDATTSNILTALDTALLAATSDDIAIVSFSGHGTRDHRLVAYDTNPGALDGSTVPMELLAERFRASKAKIIFWILDCCFSGGAPAKVLEDTPITRAILPLTELAGEGRVLLAACNVNELAYEIPGQRHGLLTKTLADVLQEWGDRVDILAATSEIFSRVAAEAARLRITQTPIVLGNVVGGLVFPRLRPGALFSAAFPEARSVQVTANLTDLTAFGFRPEVIDEWHDRFQGGLNELQLNAVNSFQVLEGKSLLVIAPTSSGKTFVGEMAAVKAIQEDRKVVFLLPYRALVNEKFEDFQALYGDRLGLRVVRCSGDYTDEASLIAKNQYDLGILTYEMFLNLSLAVPAILNQIGLVVLDEAQFIANPQRGIAVELLLTNLISARTRGIEPQIVALSAVIGNENHFTQWLGVQLLATQSRPIPLREGVLDRNGFFRYSDSDGSRGEAQLLPREKILQRGQKPSSQDVLVPLIAQLVANGEKVLVFRNTKGLTQGCAAYLAAGLGLPGAGDAIARLPEHDLTSTSTALRRSLEGGVGFHNTNLNPDEKIAVERSFRNPKGGVQVLVATSTLAAGINTPADTVIIVETEFRGAENSPYSVSDYKNMAGRAGRLGLRTEGRSILIAENSMSADRLFRTFILGTPIQLSSSFNSRDLDTWILRLLSQVKRVPRVEVPALLANTYGGFLASRSEPGWITRVSSDVERLMVRMISAGLVEQDGDLVFLTLLGRACGNSTLSFSTALQLVESLRSVGSTITAVDLVALVQSLPEADTYTPLQKNSSKEQAWPAQAARFYGGPMVNLLQRRVTEPTDYYCRAKRACVLWDWIHGVPLEHIETTYTLNPFYPIEYGNIRGFGDMTRFVLRSAAEIAKLIFPDTLLDVDSVLLQLEFGLPIEALPLLGLPVPLSRGEYLALWRAGLMQQDAILALSEEDLKRLVSLQSAARLVAHGIPERVE